VVANLVLPLAMLEIGLDTGKLALVLGSDTTQFGLSLGDCRLLLALLDSVGVVVIDTPVELCNLQPGRGLLGIDFIEIPVVLALEVLFVERLGVLKLLLKAPIVALSILQSDAQLLLATRHISQLPLLEVEPRKFQSKLRLA